MKAYRLIYVFNKNEEKNQIEYKEDIKHEGVPEEDMIQVIESCLDGINSYYANYSGEYSGYFCRFTFVRLTGGDFCFYKLDGKEGKYTACILIIKDGYLGFYPIQLYGSEVFNIDNTNNDKSLSLLFPGGLAGKLKPVEGTNFEKTSIFIKGRGDYSLRNMLDILIDNCEDTSAVRIYDGLESIVLWISAIQMAFPADVAHSIFFSIDASNSDLTECIITTSENGIKKLEETESVDIYPFNFIKGRISRPVNEFRLTRLVEMGYIISAETLNAFHRFLGKFNYKKLDNKIERCYKLFNMINFGLGNTDENEVRGAVEFACLYGYQAILEELFEGMQNILLKIDYELGIEKIKILSDFMYKTAIKSKEKIYLDKANDFFFRLMDEFVMKSSNIDVEDLLEFYESTKKLALKFMDKILKFSISTVRLKQIGEYLGGDVHPSQSEFYLKMIINDFTIIKYSWNRAMHVEGFKEFIMACTAGLPDEKTSYKKVFDIIGNDVDYFAHLSLLLYDRLIQAGNTGEFVSSFSEFISEKPSNWVEEIHDAIYEMDVNTRLLFEAFIYNLKEKANRPEYFWSSFQYGQRDIPVYYKNYTAEAVKVYLSMLDDEYLPEESEKLIKFIVEKDIMLDKETLKHVIKYYENTLQLVEPSELEGQFIQNIDRIKKEKYINTLPDISGLINFAMWVSNPGALRRLGLKDVFEECPDFKRIDNRYYQYLEWCLPHIIEYAEVSDDHKQIIDQLCKDGAEEEFFNIYIEIIEKRCLQNKSSGYSKVLNFLLNYYYYMLPKYVYMGEEHLIENMNLKIAELLEGDYIRNLNDLDKDLTYEFQKRELSVPVMWKDIYLKSREKRSNPIFNQVRKLFGRNRS